MLTAFCLAARAAQRSVGDQTPAPTEHAHQNGKVPNGEVVHSAPLPYPPGMGKDHIVQLRHKHMGGNCTYFYKDSNPLVISHARGQYLYDDAGHEYLDCINNVAHIGHCHPYWSQAIGRQLSLQATNARYLHPSTVEVARRLAESMPSNSDLSVCYFVNSGSEANDLALRMAQAHTGNTDVIALEHAYHGILTSLTAFSPYKYEKLRPDELQRARLPPDWVHIAPCPDLFRGSLRSQIPEGTNAKGAGEIYANVVKDMLENMKSAGRQPAYFIAESIQSCGGQIIYPPGYLASVYAAIREHGGLCVADEVQCGFGRSGSNFWGFEIYGDATPDIVIAGKSMGNGYPIAAVITRPEIAESFSRLWPEFFSTYGGNPASAVAALSVMEVIETERLQEHAGEVGRFLIDRLQSRLMAPNSTCWSVVGEVRGVGLMIGIEVIEPNSHSNPKPNRKLAVAIKNELRLHDRIIISTDGSDDNVLKIKPPMCFDKHNANLVVDALERAINKLLAQ